MQPQVIPAHALHDREAGFTLAETLVALTVLALTTGVLFDLIAQGTHRMRTGQAQSDASELAQSLLARAGTEIPLRTGEVISGEHRNFVWRLHVAPFGDAADQQAWPVSAYRVTAEVRWQDPLKTRTTTLETLRVGPLGASR